MREQLFHVIVLILTYLTKFINYYIMHLKVKVLINMFIHSVIIRLKFIYIFISCQ